jgi:hypothetical protein
VGCCTDKSGAWDIGTLGRTGALCAWGQ